jgi:hypothetical protein
MHFQFEVGPTPHSPVAAPTAPANSETADLLRQLLDVQREQLQLLRQRAAANDLASRWRAFLARWEGDFPGVAVGCKETLPQLERAYLSLITELTDFLHERGPDALDNEFALADMLDRYGMRLGQLGTILSLVGPLADAANTGETP